MIHSLFIINSSGDVFMEKHWKSVIHRSICDYFFEAQSKASSPEDVPPIIMTPHHYLINIYRNQLYVVAVVTTEVPPLFVVEFLHRVMDTFEDYFGECSESNIKDNYVVVYELLDEMVDNGFPLVTEVNILNDLIRRPTVLNKLKSAIKGNKHQMVVVFSSQLVHLSFHKQLLDEMLDNGFPLATESNILKELIRPPNILRTISDTVTGKSTTVSDTLPTGQLSNVPWRRTGVKYTNNEAYFDIDCLVKLSGMPDLTLSFVNPRLLDDVSFHPCVRFKRWESERILSFVPPDGNFRLISYHIGSQNSGRLDITVGPKQTMGKTVENVLVEIPFPKTVLNVTLTTNQGKYSFDPVTKLMTWDVGKIDPTKLPNIRGSINLQSNSSPPESNPAISVQFTISQMAVSGIKVNRLDMYGEKYKPFKGVKYITKAGKFQVRT
ncbi:hypothetical protein LSH36_1461g00046 [Paralvinella palmiformis]|uniref:MHD domain-containing protein n=1 Tax=Paralvinella palmiformis TaxID=53620 RepID=A0AAD9IU58_9ANNE|nr:hypothetical protein LSH36_1461g00046 [Paralvinella palmiformis]